MRPQLLLALIVALSACQRSAPAPTDAGGSASALPPPAGSAAAASSPVAPVAGGAPTPSATAAASARRAAAALAASAAPAATGSTSTGVLGDRLHPADPCYGLSDSALDECLGIDGARREDPAVADFRAEQARRDRQLLDQDAEQAAQAADAREREPAPPSGQDDAAYGDPPPEEVPPAELPPEDLPPADQPDDPEQDAPPPDDGYYNR